MTHRTIPHLGGLPDPHSGGLPEILVFYFAPCHHVETIKEKQGGLNLPSLAWPFTPICG